MAMEWITAMDKRPCDRNLRDVELISCRLRRVEPLCRLPGSALQQLAMCGFYEDLEKGVTLFRAGEQGRFWYAVLGGSLEVRYHAHADADGKVSERSYSSSPSLPTLPLCPMPGHAKTMPQFEQYN
ncbi:uncharacterized protein Dwil_GK22150 [Drosophila willistoni]|uniref:Cyclic nucleotide-binding domain-containing protein n=1 Tax=Drosophila willistoni TaxID=7260 RepID=B4MY41_DROWI|nr:uncharacterized protein Dwil_GK22150 [Drosophila willistoni]